MAAVVIADASLLIGLARVNGLSWLQALFQEVLVTDVVIGEVLTGTFPDVEADSALQRALKHCRSRNELILAARRLGYRITRIDLQRAWQEAQREQEQAAQG